MTDQVDSFDGTNSYLSYNLGGWNDLPTQDLYMVLKLSHFTSPVITVVGTIPTTVEKGAAYVDPGAKAFDIADGNITSSVVTTPNVNTAVLGNYTVDYSVTNSHGSTVHSSRPVQVVNDATPPVITIKGVNPITIKVSSTYVDAGATALDAVSGNLTSSIVTQNAVNTSTNGTYLVNYTVSDQAGNTAHATRTVAVSNDNVPPVITLKGINPLTVGKGILYVDPGATATDNQDGNITSTIVKVSTVNTGIIGTYTVTFNVSDKVGNAATPVTRTVNVIDTSPPISMNDTTNSYGLETYSGRPIMGEFVSPTSSLVGKIIDSMTVRLQAQPSLTGSVLVGVFASNQTLLTEGPNQTSTQVGTASNNPPVKMLFGSMDVSTMTIGSYTPYTFSLPQFQKYQIAPGDVIGIQYTGGNATNSVAIMTDQNGTFDGSNSYLGHYDGTNWINDDPADASLLLQNSLIQTSLPVVTPPQDILSVTTNSTRNIPDLGTPTITYNGPSPVITNNSTGQFPIGTTNILWSATTSQGNVGTAIQKVTVISALPATNQLNKVAMVNFDDDFESEFTLGLPVLNKYDIKSTVYQICGTTGESDYMNWSQVMQTIAQGHDVQSHTMTHFHGSNSTIPRITYEYGQAKPCLIANGTTNVHIAAMPYHEGYNNATVINIISQYYEFSRGGTGHSFYLHCNDPFSTETNCATFDANSNLNLFNRYNIRAWSSDSPAALFNYNDAISFGQFIQEVNSATSNTGPNSTEVPIVLYHRVVQDNSLIPDPQLKGTTVKLLDAEMKYLRDNNFRIYTTKDLHYDTVKNWFYLSGPTVYSSLPSGSYVGSQSVKLTASTPGTIYYTTDGSTPTTSSPSGPSPLSLTVSSTSTLKFFTVDPLGNTGSIGSVTYTIIPYLQVLPSLANGTYNSIQSVTLTSTPPAKIFYTTDGSTPTTSSTNGTSPLLLTVNTNSTLKYFARDASNVVGPLGTSSYTIIYPVVTQMSDTTASNTVSTYSGRQIQGEFVSPTSSLAGKPIDTITVRLTKVGSSNWHRPSRCL